MKNVYALLALAASLGEVSATFGNGGPKFNCPDNTNNNCPPKLVSGFDWSDLPTGPFSSYGGFQWNKWSCASNFGKRDTDIFNPVLPRTGGKAITGSCAPQKELCPSFGCDFAGAEIEAFSVVAFSIVPEFSCDLEFHFGMGDGSTCKQRSHCDKSGSTVKNTQCGGAKNVTVVYPSQPTMPKPTCSVGIHSMSFDCSPPKTSKPPKTTTLSTKVRTTTTSIIATTTSTTSKVIITTPTSTSSAVSPTAVQSTSTPAVSTSSTPAVSTPQTTLTSVATTTTPVQFTTSTVFTTIVSTVTSCGPEVTNCPGHSTVLTTVTVALSTTICPVTETQSVSSTLAISVTKSTTASVVVPPVSSSTGVVPPASSTSVVVPPASSTSSAVVVPPPQTSTSATLPAPPPVQTLPCPEVLPNCINTWLFSVGCSGNTDSGCYCPDELFVQNIFSCVYAHGETDEIVSQAVVFFQGICAPYVPQNPGIATGASTITSVLTVTSSQPVQATYTTVVVTATTVVPCVTNGSTIPGSSITTTITNSLTVPQVGFTTQSSGAVGVIPVTTPIPIVSPTPTPTGSNGSPAPVSPVGTGGFTRTSGLPSVVTAAANKVGSGVGLGLAVLAAVAAL